jgi:hypothetical protein
MDATTSHRFTSKRIALQTIPAALVAAVVFGAGCHRPWYAEDDAASDIALRSYDRAPVRSASAVPSAAAESKITSGQNAVSTGTDPFDVAQQKDDVQTIAAIATELEDIGEIDPAAREQFLADLRDVEPRYWPQMVKTFRATLAYRREHRKPAGSTESTADNVTVSFATDRDAVQGDEAKANSPLPDDKPVSKPLPEPEPVELAADFRTDPLPRQEGASTEPRHQDAGVVNAIFEPQVIEEPARNSDPRETERPQTPATADTWQSLLDRAIGQLEAETAAAPATSGEITEHARLRFLYLARGDYDAALLPIDGAPPNHQDFWSKLLFAVATYFDDQAQPDLRRRASLARHHLAGATDLLGEIATLDVRNLTFCTEIRGFGIYDPIDAPAFRAGEQVKLYAEVANYKSDQSEGGFRTLLATSYEVLDASGQRVDSGEFPQVEDTCRSRRQDFHIQYGVNLPARIYPGTYRLELTIEDMLSRKLGRASVAFEIKGEGGERK